MPSPVATGGFVVSRNTCPAPPVASSVACARTSCGRPVSIEVADAEGAAILAEQLRHERMMDDGDRRQRGHALVEHPANLAAGGVAGVQHAPDRVRGLAPERGTSVRVAIEPRAPLEQLADVDHAFFDQHADGRFIAEAVAGADGVGGVEGRAVIVAHRRRDAALRVSGVALAGLGFGENQRAAGAREADGGAQSGDPAADDEESL